MTSSAIRRHRRAARPHFRVDVLHELIDGNHLTEASFARRVGVRRRAVTAWLQGLEPDFAAVLSMAAEFDKPLRFFIQPAETAEPER